MSDITVDPASFELAEHFLADQEDATEAMKWALARAIQQAVEDWFEGGCT